MSENYTPNTQPTPPAQEPGKGAAIGSLVCGIVGTVFGVASWGTWFLVWPPILALIVGIVGMVLAASAKKAGFNGGMRTAGFVLALLGVIFGAIGLVACIACYGTVVGAASGLAALGNL